MPSTAAASVNVSSWQHCSALISFLLDLNPTNLEHATLRHDGTNAISINNGIMLKPRTMGNGLHVPFRGHVKIPDMRFF